MPLKADVSALFELAKAFGPEGTKLALDATKGAVEGATAAAERTLVQTLRKEWPRSEISQNVESAVRVTPREMIGVVTVTHDWVGPLVLGETVPPHVFAARGAGQGPYVMTVGKGGEPKTYRAGPLAGEGPPVFIRSGFTHPGYKGKDCATRALKTGEQTLRRLIERVVLKLAQALLRRRGGGA